jgi:carboxymethylenebutenolidase
LGSKAKETLKWNVKERPIFPKVCWTCLTITFTVKSAVANKLAVRLPDLAAAVSFYGRQPSAEETAKIKAPLLLHYASLDTRVNGGWPAYEEALKANHVSYTAYIYEGANHGFHNDTTPRYDESAAKLAWQRTLDFFNMYLRAE